MDKKQVKEYVKTIIKTYLVLVGGIAVPANIFFSLLSSISKGNFLKLAISNTITLIITSLSLVISVCIGLFVIYILSENRRRRDRVTTDDYIRELPKYFPPAIASFLLDLNLEITTDYTATIAYLIFRKYIELQENKVNVLNNSCENLSLHEKYVLDCITEKKVFDNNEFIKLVMNDAEKMNFIKIGKRKVNFFRNFGLLILVYAIFQILATVVFKTGIFNFIFSIFSIISVISIEILIGYSIYTKIKYSKQNFSKTSLGNAEAKKWSAVKNFLKDYTLVSDKNLQDIVIWENYIPYAISLNEAKTIEKYIENNESYRKLIYGNYKQS